MQKKINQLGGKNKLLVIITIPHSFCINENEKNQITEILQ